MYEKMNPVLQIKNKVPLSLYNFKWKSWKNHTQWAAVFQTDFRDYLRVCSCSPSSWCDKCFACTFIVCMPFNDTGGSYFMHLAAAWIEALSKESASRCGDLFWYCCEHKRRSICGAVWHDSKAGGKDSQLLSYLLFNLTAMQHMSVFFISPDALEIVSSSNEQRHMFGASNNLEIGILQYASGLLSFSLSNFFLTLDSSSAVFGIYILYSTNKTPNALYL